MPDPTTTAAPVPRCDDHFDGYEFDLGCDRPAGHEGEHAGRLTSNEQVLWPRLPGEGMRECPDCAGMGWRVVRRSGSVTGDCGTCEGTGRVDAL